MKRHIKLKESHMYQYQMKLIEKVTLNQIKSQFHQIDMEFESHDKNCIQSLEKLREGT